MRRDKKDLENRYIADRKHSKDQIKTLSAGYRAVIDCEERASID